MALVALLRISVVTIMVPRVTMAMPVRNGSAHIRSAIESILAQDFSDLELIVTDNASDDATPEICSEIARADRRLRFVANPKNLGAAPNYNRGFELARGEYLKWCAHDDLISSNYVSSCLAALEADPEASVAYGRTLCIDAEGREIDGDDDDEMQSLVDPSPARRFIMAVRQSGTCFPIFGLFRRSLLARSTLHRMYYGSDRALIAEMALLGRCLLVPEATFYNREHLDRSIRIVDHGARSKWQSASASRAATMEHVCLVTHLAEIAVRHPRVASALSTLPPLAAHALKPRQLGQVALDLIRYTSPVTGAWLRRSIVGPPAAPKGLEAKQ